MREKFWVRQAGLKVGVVRCWIYSNGACFDGRERTAIDDNKMPT